MYIEKKQFYNNTDIDHMLVYLRANRRANEMFKKVINGYGSQDVNAILGIIANGYSESFDRYDSAVADIFVRSFEETFLKGHGLPQFFIVAKRGNEYNVLDVEDVHNVETMTKAELDKAVSLGFDIGGYNINWK